MKGFRFASYISSSFPKLLVAITSSSACRSDANNRTNRIRQAASLSRMESMIAAVGSRRQYW
jgi:hypothetical protein